MGKYTHVYDRWPGYSVADCQCCYCLYYPGKNKPCPLEVCCCAEEREEAFRREQLVKSEGRFRSAAAA